MTIKTSNWGVVQALDVEADTKNALLSAISIAMTYNQTVRSFRVIHDKKFTPSLLLHSVPSERATPFLTPIKSPEVLCNHVMDWLAQEDIVPRDNLYTHGDGSSKKGFKLFIPTATYLQENRDSMINQYDCVFIVQPHYIYYSK